MSDREFQSGDMLFEWDENKNRLNKIKHKISFETAVNIFLDENIIELYDAEHSDFEDRWQAIGKAGNVLFVVYTERGEKTRIISARKATAEERSWYYGNRDLYFA